MILRRAALAGVIALASVSSAAADDVEHVLMARVRLTTEPALTKGCTAIAWVSDDSLKDLRRKIVRAGGDTGLLSFRMDDLEVMQAEVFRCPRPMSGPPPPPSPPAVNVPPPPPGPPPPPPSGPYR